MSRFYNDIITQLFLQPQHAGHLPQANLTLQVGNPGQSDLIYLEVLITADRISNACFKAQGKMTTIAAAEFICRQLKGMTRDQLPKINSKFIETALQLPSYRLSSAVLAEQAIIIINQQWDKQYEYRTN